MHYFFQFYRFNNAYYFLLLWQLAVFHCGSWPFFIVAVGRFSLWQLAGF